MELQKLIEGKEHYPPSFELWRSIINLTKEHSAQKTQRTQKTLEQQMLREVAKYKPDLPEPAISRFIHDNRFYFLDEKNNIYTTDPSTSAIVGNLVGKIDENNRVIINNQCVHELTQVKVTKKFLPNNPTPFYIDPQTDTAYKGFQETHKLIYDIGKLDGEKIKLSS